MADDHETEGPKMRIRVTMDENHPHNAAQIVSLRQQLRKAYPDVPQKDIEQRIRDIWGALAGMVGKATEDTLREMPK